MQIEKLKNELNEMSSIQTENLNLKKQLKTMNKKYQNLFDEYKKVKEKLKENK